MYIEYCNDTRSETQGTETSKYLNEKIVKSFFRVVASEKERAQTELRFGVIGQLKKVNLTF